MTRSLRRLQRGFGAITAVIVLVVVAGLATAMVRLASAQQTTIAWDVGQARALDAARSGLQWGLYQALKGPWLGCVGATQTLDLRASTGFLVTVSCSSRSYNSGEVAAGVPRVISVSTLEATACNGTGASCPGDATASNYIERKLQAMTKGP